MDEGRRDEVAHVGNVHDIEKHVSTLGIVANRFINRRVGGVGHDGEPRVVEVSLLVSARD